MVLADILSKGNTQTILDCETAAYIHFVVNHLSISNEILKTIKHKTYIDPALKT